MMENFKFKKTLNFDEGSIEVRYEGVPLSKDIDTTKIEELLNDFMDNENHTDMIRNVSFLRTILKDYKEKLLVVYYEDDKGTELVKYDNSNLFLFEKSQKNDDNDELTNSYNMKYDSSYGITIDYSGEVAYMDNYSDVQTTSENISKMMNHIYQLKRVHAIELDRDSKALVEIYKLFYNENPNFSDKSISVKVQTMMSILSEFGISLGDDYSFTNLPKLKLPLSLTLANLVKKLYPFGEINYIVEPVKLAEHSKNIIKIVGENIRKTIEQVDNKDEILVKISQIIYASRYKLSTNANVNEICEFTNLSSDEVKSSIRLVKRIENKINKQL